MKNALPRPRGWGLKCAILLSTLYAVVMMLHWPIGFTFFTQLSNLYAAAVVIAQLALPGRRKKLALWKYTAAVSIAVTFWVYLLVLAPLMPGGPVAAYAQDHCASLCLHVITPLLTVADFVRYDAAERSWRAREALWAVVPPVAYFLFILALGALGFRWMAGMAAPYPFLNYLAPAGWFGFLPNTAGPTSLGIGVAYAIAALLALVLLVARLLLIPVCHGDGSSDTHFQNKVPWGRFW